MDRRKSCRTAIAASVAAAIPMLPGCSKQAPVATEADTSIRAISLGGYYDNIDFDDDAAGARYYGPAYARLRQIKSRYDPGNLFRLNSNIEAA